MMADVDIVVIDTGVDFSDEIILKHYSSASIAVIKAFDCDNPSL